MQISRVGRKPLSYRPDRSESHPVVRQVQQALNRLAGVPVLTESGVFDRATRAALRLFQERVGLPASGVIDQATVDALNRALAGHERGRAGTPDTFERTGAPTPFGRMLRSEVGPYVEPFLDAQRKVREHWDTIHDRFLKPLLTAGAEVLQRLQRAAVQAEAAAAAYRDEIRQVVRDLEREDVPAAVKDRLRKRIRELCQQYRLHMQEAEALQRDIARFGYRLEKARDILEKIARGVDVTADIADLARAFVDQYESSTARTPVGRALDAAVYAGIRYVMGRWPVVSTLDAAMAGYLGRENSLSGFMSAVSRATVTFWEAVFTQETEGLESFMDLAAAGRLGTLFRLATEAGEYYAEHGFFTSIRAALNVKEYRYLYDNFFLDLETAGNGGRAGGF